MQYYSPENSDSQENLKVLEKAALTPAESMEADPAFQEAFNAELRQLAQDIIEHNPSLTQLLLSLSEPAAMNPLHGRN